MHDVMRRIIQGAAKVWRDGAWKHGVQEDWWEDVKQSLSLHTLPSNLSPYFKPSPLLFLSHLYENIPRT